jgi:uncharacterized protein
VFALLLDLKSIIETPGGEIGFECELDTSELDFPWVKSFIRPPRAKGGVKNSAGALTLTAVLDADMICLCDRCGTEFTFAKRQEIEAALADTLEDEESPDVFLLAGDFINADEVLRTYFLLEMEPKFLCFEDCAGLCETCGQNLNESPCNCDKTDPRLASLRQLLDEFD